MLPFIYMKDLTEGHNFVVFDSAEYVGGICANDPGSDRTAAL